MPPCRTTRNPTRSRSPLVRLRHRPPVRTSPRSPDPRNCCRRTRPVSNLGHAGTALESNHRTASPEGWRLTGHRLGLRRMVVARPSISTDPPDGQPSSCADSVRRHRSRFIRGRFGRSARRLVPCRGIPGILIRDSTRIVRPSRTGVVRVSRLFAGTPWDRPPTCDCCGRLESQCSCPPAVPEAKRIPPDQQAARLMTERRAKGKLVTVIAGLDAEANDLNELGARLKNACGAGGTVKERADRAPGRSPPGGREGPPGDRLQDQGRPRLMLRGSGRVCRPATSERGRLPQRVRSRRLRRVRDQVPKSGMPKPIDPSGSADRTDAAQRHPWLLGRSDRSIVQTDRRQRGGECAAAGRRALEERFEQPPVRLERADHEPDRAGPVGRRRCSAADRVRRIRVRDVPRHSLDNGPPPGHHGAARFGGGRPAPGLRRHGGELVPAGPSAVDSRAPGMSRFQPQYHRSQESS